jgi:hypothetical protein
VAVGRGVVLVAERLEQPRCATRVPEDDAAAIELADPGE